MTERLTPPSFPRKTNTDRSLEKKSDTQSDADTQNELDNLLSDPGNKFLLEIAANRDFLENASPQEALTYAWNKIEARLQRTFHYEYVQSLQGVMPERVSYRGMSRALDAILRGQREIGRGGDAFVVIDKNEVRDLPPEICYKFSIAEKTPRGRNDTFEEMKMQDAFYGAAEEAGSKIGVPIPFYAVEISGKKVLAMEKLNAASIDDILRSRRDLPAWIDINELCAELKKTIDYFHTLGLFHRDMHFGNIMISQSPERKDAERMAYIIDFGLSAHATEEMEPYKKEVAGAVFTYTNDHAIIEGVRSELNALRSRRHI